MTSDGIQFPTSFISIGLNIDQFQRLNNMSGYENEAKDNVSNGEIFHGRFELYLPILCKLFRIFKLTSFVFTVT